MSLSEPSVRAIFRSCVVNAVRRGEELMAQLVQTLDASLAAQETSTTQIAQRELLGDARQQLHEHEGALVKGYPMALLDVFAEGPAPAQSQPASLSGMDFGELSLVDDVQMQVQMEFARTQEMALHTTDAALTELNTLVSSAQGLRSVQPERNPLRPQSYIRALQRVIGETGVAGPVRELWMRYLRDPLSEKLSSEYQFFVQSLRQQGVRPVGYAVAATPGRTSVQGGGYAPSQQGGAYATGYGQPSRWSSGYPPVETQEALLTVTMLRQMLAAQGSAPGWVPWPGQVAAAAVGQQVPVGAYAPQGGATVSSAQADVEALQDIAQLERLVGALTSQPIVSAQVAGAGVAVGHAASDPQLVGQGVLRRMMEHLLQDARLLPAVQQVLRTLEPALQQLVRYDPAFFSDATHPARQLLDAVTERSLSFESETAPGFERFIRLVREAFAHLGGQPIENAQPFAAVLKALQLAWETQARKAKAQAQALKEVQQRAQLAAQIAAKIRTLEGADQVPPEFLTFATETWAEVVALAHLRATEAELRDGDPGGYLALIGPFFWSVQPAQVGTDVAQLHAVQPLLQEKIRAGLELLGRSNEHIDAFLAQLQACHDALERTVQTSLAPAPAPTLAHELQAAGDVPALSTLLEAPQKTFEASTSEIVGSTLNSELDAQIAPAPSSAPAPVDVDFRVGVWVELVQQRRSVRTQLTWVSPQHTLFLFTAKDGSTQSMTLRMRDKLLAEGNLRIVAPPSRRASTQ